MNHNKIKIENQGLICEDPDPSAPHTTVCQIVINGHLYDFSLVSINANRIKLAHQPIHQPIMRPESSNILNKNFFSLLPDTPVTVYPLPSPPAQNSKPLPHRALNHTFKAKVLSITKHLDDSSQQAIELTLEPLPSEHSPFAAISSKLQTGLRKSQHLDLCDRGNVEHTSRFSGFDDFSFVPLTIPRICPSKTSTQATFCQKTFSAPFFVTPMTGGTEQGRELNDLLATACLDFGIPMGIGSQRIALEDPSLASMFKVKKTHPGLFVMANLGISQLCEDGAVSKARRAIDMVDADILTIHVNILQELIQQEGQRAFPHLWLRIEECVRNSPVPVMIKEVGGGIDLGTVSRLRDIGITMIDVSGAGGTSWSAIEGARHSQAWGQKLGETFRDWGIPTAYNLKTIAQHYPDLTLTATGGVRNGLQIAKAVALGADMVGIGLPVLKAALEDLRLISEGMQDSPRNVLQLFDTLRRGVYITQALTSSATLQVLRSPSKLIPHRFPYGPNHQV